MFHHVSKLSKLSEKTKLRTSYLSYIIFSCPFHVLRNKITHVLLECKKDEIPGKEIADRKELFVTGVFKICTLHLPQKQPYPLV